MMFLKGFCKYVSIKGIKGSRRKRIYIYKKDHTSTQFFNNKISYYLEDCLTIFGILGIKVWIVY